ncbi:hypothetical protein Rsub_03322 [Raphidocelis subcapitata]|uniref:Uncharacterized protein n=1 Tax=Raphidocelis subcapitata TaxID=307507 RepID=A0A2V0NPA6_9CHLO|nr:hypothetical protein Rsub_01826 [Raphidocelis subcapitata]GBF90189.1 hypothetical protein Rsub_03322 [Raphidocelis subcapitata]|eukprot:GBF89109.1 hypothetical protein Rsub_01826 [Raphidocelis subcapitata]
MSATRRALAAAARGTGAERAPLALRVRASGRRGRGAAVGDAGGATADLCAALVEGSGLSDETARRVAAAAAQPHGPSRSAPALAGRIATLQRMLGRADADKAIRAFPQLLACRVEELELRLQMWEDAFPSAPPADLRRRLLAQPQLLAVAVESTVPGLFEMAVIAGVERGGWEGWAYKSLRLALYRPEKFRARLWRTLAMLNGSGGGDAGGAADGTAAGDGGSGKLDSGGEPDGSPEPQAAADGLFTFADVQAAVRRDHRWLLMREEAVKARLEALQGELEVPWPAVARAFLQQPNIVCKRPETLAPRARAFLALGGVGRARALRALCLMPSLLSLKPEVVAARWRALERAAAAHPPWRAQLAAAAAGSVASMLVRSGAVYARLEYLEQTDQWGGSLKTIMDMGAAKFAARFPEFELWRRVREGLDGPEDASEASAAAAAGEQEAESR